MLFRVAIALLGQHKDGLLTCDSFEEIMDYLKNVVPAVDKKILDKVMKQVILRHMFEVALGWGVRLTARVC